MDLGYADDTWGADGWFLSPTMEIWGEGSEDSERGVGGAPTSPTVKVEYEDLIKFFLFSLLLHGGR